MGWNFPDGFIERLDRAAARAGTELLGFRNAEGHWEGELSSSALSTATAACALAIASRNSTPQTAGHTDRALAGLEWLADHQNSDGGWGDTTISLSNISTTALCWAAYGAIPKADERFRAVVERAEKWLTRKAGGIEPNVLAPAIIRRYGKDRTFSVPILTMCALAGRLGMGREAWRWVIPLPFELAALPHQFYAALRLPVVSYALPALIAIGYARHYQRPSRNPIIRALRASVRSRTLRILTSIQPSTGGFLEATPLTSFVVMSLASSDLADHPVTRNGVDFLMRSAKPDGSWPIDTNLATWVTTLSTNALLEPRTSIAARPVPDTRSKPPILSDGDRASIRDWLLGQQYQTEHPYTHTPPGAWAWTDLPGGVPDADDTAGALLALRNLGEPDPQTRSAALDGVTWLLNLQNRDGGIPTFCRGWGALPFDQSAPDLTAHAMRAWLAWIDHCPDQSRARIESAIHKGALYLSRAQQTEGSWIPLWFGNQYAPDDENPTYGTARVLSSIVEIESAQPKNNPDPESRRFPMLEGSLAPTISKGAFWLTSAQHASGGWGGIKDGLESVEETALAVESLAALLDQSSGILDPATRRRIHESIIKGANWLIDGVEIGAWLKPSPIGFYFAKLWYFEKLYPAIFTVAALNRLRRSVARGARRREPA